MELSQLSLPQLLDLERQLPLEIKRRKEADKLQLKTELSKIAAEKGFQLDELFGQPKPTRQKASVKFRHPQNAALEWTGRGRRPAWVTHALETGLTIDQLQV